MCCFKLQVVTRASVKELLLEADRRSERHPPPSFLLPYEVVPAGSHVQRNVPSLQANEHSSYVSALLGQDGEPFQERDVSASAVALMAGGHKVVAGVGAGQLVDSFWFGQAEVVERGTSGEDLEPTPGTSVEVPVVDGMALVRSDPVPADPPSSSAHKGFPSISRPICARRSSSAPSLQRLNTGTP